jgi:predicted transcriptional regulator
MTRTPPDISPAEFDLMKILWRLGRATVAEVRREAAGDDDGPAYTTVMTLLGRLEKKGAVAVDKSRQPYVYRPRFRRESVIRRRLHHFVDRVFDGQVESLVMQLIEDRSLSLDELRELEARVAARIADEDPSREEDE